MELLNLGSLESRAWDKELGAGGYFGRWVREPGDWTGLSNLLGALWGGPFCWDDWTAYRTLKIVLQKDNGSCSLSLESFPTCFTSPALPGYAPHAQVNKLQDVQNAECSVHLRWAMGEMESSHITVHCCYSWHQRWTESIWQRYHRHPLHGRSSFRAPEYLIIK